MEGIQEWFSKNITFFGWALSVIIVFIVSRLIVQTDNLLIQFNILLLLLIIAVGLAVMLYVNDFNYRYFRYFDFIQCMPTETTMIKFQKKVIFTEDALGKDGHAAVESCRVIQNNMKKNTYNLFQIIISSESYVPHVKNMTINVDGKDLDPEKDIVTPKLFAQFRNEDNKKEKPVKMIKEFFVPVDIPSGETSTTTISYKSAAYKQAINSKKDWVSLECNRLTKELAFEVLITGNLKNTHKLSRINQRDEYHKIVEFIVFDASMERMVISENELRDQKNQPKFSDNSIVWKITNPKVGYVYRLFFTLLPKDSDSHQTDHSGTSKPDTCYPCDISKQ